MSESIGNIAGSTTTDRLSPFFATFALSARVFYSGRLCGISGNHEDNVGHLHVLRRGVLTLTQFDGRRIVIDQPSVVFYPRPGRHRFQADEEKGAELVCASIEFGAGMLNPLVRTLPNVLIVPLSSAEELTPTVELLFAEAFSRNPGRQAAVDRLAEYFLILLLRVAMKTQPERGGILKAGVLLGLADPRLSKAIAAIHERPEHAWSLAELAQAAGMSRARFAMHFRKIVGMTPFEYLADWRIGVAQALLRRGKLLKIVAPSVGYSSAGALTRVFCQRVGTSPKEWLSRGVSDGT